MSEQNNAEEIFNILKNMYQEMVGSKSCHICKYHTNILVLIGGAASQTGRRDFCEKRMQNCPYHMSCNDFEVMKMNREYIVLPEMCDLSETLEMNSKFEIDIISKLYFLISFKETARIQNIIECANARDKKEIAEHIDELVNYSIDRECHEITAYLLDYKYKNNLFPLKYLELE